MSRLDYCVILAYAVGLLVVGAIFSRRMRDSSDMFVAGGQSPWWVAGLSGFMTMFSAGTFVVWGGIAYRSGLVAVSICLGNGVGVLIAGYLVAARWRRLGVTTAAEYFELRFGETAVRLYTVFNLLYKMVAIAVALYAIAVLVCALTPLSEGAPLRDAATGHLAVPWAIAICGVIVVAYTVAGGLWAVLMTDVLQFLVLTLCVLVVVPLSLARAGGPSGFASGAPAGFFSLATDEFTWWFLAGWVAIQFASVGGEWAFVQRFLCVPTPKDARRGAYLFGILYLISPLIWMLPPMLYRTVNPQADPEEAYILACQAVLPAGMVGLMIAAMFSATASMVDSQLNVFAGVLTRDFYHRLVRPQASEKHLVLVGRVIAALLGAVLIGGTLAVPALGGAEKTALGIAALLIGPLMLPTIWGLFSRRVGRSSVWLTVAVSFTASALVKFGLTKGGWFDGIRSLDWMTAYVQDHLRTVETLVAVVVPLSVLLVLELCGRGIDQGWQRVAAQARKEKETKHGVPKSSALPARLVAWSMGILAVLMAALAWLDPQQRPVLAAACAALAAGAALCWWVSRAHDPSR